MRSQLFILSAPSMGHKVGQTLLSVPDRFAYHWKTGKSACSTRARPKQIELEPENDAIRPRQMMRFVSFLPHTVYYLSTTY